LEVVKVHLYGSYLKQPYRQITVHVYDKKTEKIVYFSSDSRTLFLACLWLFSPWWSWQLLI